MTMCAQHAHCYMITSDLSVCSLRSLVHLMTLASSGLNIVMCYVSLPLRRFLSGNRARYSSHTAQIRMQVCMLYHCTLNTRRRCGVR